MNTIKVTEILGTDSIAGSRIIINDNFSMLQSGVNEILSLIDITNKSIRVNSIETETGDFVIFMGENDTPRFSIKNDGSIIFGTDDINIGTESLKDYILRVVQESGSESGNGYAE